MSVRPGAAAESDLYAHLAEVSLDDPRSFAQSVLEILCDRFDLLAGSVYIHSEGFGHVRLRAQVGFDYAAYEDFDVPMRSFPGQAISTKGPLVSSDLAGSGLYRDLKLLEGSAVTTIIVVPLLLADGAGATAAAALGAPNPLGALCLYPNETEQASTLVDVAQRFAPFIARLYLATMERAAMRLRRTTVDRVAYKRDVGSLANTFLEVVVEELSVEAAALWIFDARRDAIYRRRALRAKKPEVRGEYPWLIPSADSLIAECFRRRRHIVHDHHHPLIADIDVDLLLAHSLDNWEAVPIALHPEARLRGRATQTAGVLELANHYTAFGEVRHLTTPNWEDAYFSDFACELLSVLLYQVLRTQDHESDFERLLHGARQSLQAARSHLQGLEGLEDAGHLVVPRSHIHFIPNAIDWLEDLEAQINRDDIVSRPKLECEPLPLYGQVLAKLSPMVRRMNTRDPDQPIALLGLDELAQHYLTLPYVSANRQALDCVFRNLLDNSWKYCRPPSGLPREVTIRALVGESGDRLVLLVSDNGEGIPRDEAELVFEDGFRGRFARGVRPQGVGRGLYDCHRLMLAMKGSISVVPVHPCVTFRLELPTASPVTRR